ncbi:MAG: hypothetical protein ACKVYV_14980 [Limisphaerales bacterium]
MKIAPLAILCAAALPLAARADVLLDESFAYPNGWITDVSGGQWTVHSPSPAASNLVVNAGMAIINQGDTAGGRDDAARLLSSPVDPSVDNTTKLYAALTVSFSALPAENGASVGSYFAHFKSSAANEFYGRLGASTAGAAAGSFRVGIGSETWGTATVFAPQDLSLNTTYNLVIRYDLDADRATLWVNPADESSPSVTSTDAPSYSPGTINAFALRQGTSAVSGNNGAPGVLAVDNLRVATTFAQAVPEPGGAMLALLGGGLVWLLRRRA